MYPRKTRKNTRGKCQKLTKRGGARATLPVPNSFEDFSRTWDILYVSAHGGLSGNMMVVPENTYILNLATAGKICNKVVWDIENWIYDYSPTARPVKTILQKMYDALKGNSFLSDYMYTPGNVNTNVLEQYPDPPALAAAEVPLTRQQKSLAYYEPGDIMFDTTLSFVNHNYPVFLMGAYEVPISHELKRSLFRINKHLYRGEDYNNAGNVNTMNSEDVLRYLSLVPPEEFERHPPAAEHQIFNRDDNLLKNQMFPMRDPVPVNQPLSEVIPFINTSLQEKAVAAGGAEAKVKPFKLIIIKACRVALNPNVATRMRRYSIAARTRNTKRVTVDGVAIPRAKLNLAYLARLKAALQRYYSSPVTTDPKRLIIQKVIADITRIESGSPFSVELIEDILQTVKTMGGLQTEIGSLLRI